MQNPEREVHAMGIQFYDRLIYRPEYGYSCSYYQERINQIIDSYTDLAYDEDPDNLIFQRYAEFLGCIFQRYQTIIFLRLQRKYIHSILTVSGN